MRTELELLTPSATLQSVEHLFKEQVGDLNDISLNLSETESIDDFLRQQALDANRVAVGIDGMQVGAYEVAINALPPYDERYGPVTLLEVCVLAGELGECGNWLDAGSQHPNANRVCSLDMNVVKRLLDQILVARYPEASLRILGTTGLMQFLLPEVYNLKNFHQSSLHHHKDVYAHTLKVVAQSIPDRTVRWAALLHDVGKFFTRSYGEGGQVHFFRHDEVGAFLTDGILARLRFQERDRIRVTRLVRMHLRPGQYACEWSDSAVNRLMVDAGEILPELLHLARADNTTRRMHKRLSNIRNVKSLAQRCAALKRKEERRSQRLPRGLGMEIKKTFCLDFGPSIGRYQSMCRDALTGGELPAGASIEECLVFLRKKLAENE